ncbi:hypothetical protein [Methylococcus geothermalis]|uniref:Uncharacterized protein n=1 Tax=Methylococcus geothermalis TaxID=2681310 RepID=A0A858Q8X8_9GAMM|nr:hypothetical protein [Methylococcus geothermalis]QJD30290.1 hypothetical protein GNH96_10125 [Methylococcus geothermalis]
MNKTFLSGVLAVSAILPGAEVHAAKAAAPPTAPAARPAEQDELALFRASIRMEKRQFVADAMDLDEAQGKQFWSIYHQYEADLMKLNETRYTLISDYAANFDTISEAKADALVRAALAFRKSRTALLEKYYGKLAKALSKRIGARFLQIENVLQGAEDVEIGASLPLMPKSQ